MKGRRAAVWQLSQSGMFMAVVLSLSPDRGYDDHVNTRELIAGIVVFRYDN